MFGRTGFTFASSANAGATGEQPSRLPAEERGGVALDEPELEQLAEALVHLREHRARGDRRDDRVRQRPAELLGDLERERLRALGVVRAEPDVDERPVELERQLDAQAAAVVVAALDRDRCARRRWRSR